ncbi:MAG: LysR family transcriptional regulator [Deltaproteobacteria bacterium]|nr:MAG: LysR family transcriptional regulator [Deltaproteobacteria bacterium]
MKLKKAGFDFKQVEVFCQVVRLGSFSEAARAMSLTQPTLSAHVASLEWTLGVRLLDRKGRKVHLTRAGRVFHDYTLSMLALKEKAERAMSTQADHIKGELNVGGSTIPGTYVLPPLIGRFRGRYPDVLFNLVVGDTREIVDKVKVGSVELGVVGSHPSDRSLETREFWKDELSLVVPPSHKWARSSRGVDPREVLGEPFILRESGSATRELMESVLKKKGIRARELKVACRLGSTEAVKQGIRAGMGVSILSKKAVEVEVENGLLRTVPIRGTRFTRCFYLISHASRTMSPAGQAFLEFLSTQKESR